MGLFDNLFGKKPCVLCGAEVGAMHRDKIKNKEYVCNECAKKCSQYVRLSEMDKDTVQEHIAFMEKRERIYQQFLSNITAYPSTVKEFGLKFSDDIGMLGIVDRKNHKSKVNHEVIRYDEIASYEYYKEMNKPSQEGGQETFKEDGVILRFLDPRKADIHSEKSGIRVHPYLLKEIKLCFRTSEKETDYTENAIQHLDHIFGVHDSEHGLFSIGMTTAEKRDLKAKADVAKFMGSAVKAAIKGESGEGLQEQFAQAQQSADDAMTGGLAVYSRRADDAENSVAG